MLNKAFLPITLISLLFIFMISRGCSSSHHEIVSVEGTGVGVSMPTQARVGSTVLDLSADLDPAQVPEIVKQSYMAGASQKLQGKELVSYVIQDVSEKVSAISTIDLNEDNTPDPILIVPEGDTERMTFSVRVPDPAEVKTYPDDPQAWQSIADKQAVEVLSVTVFPRVLNGELKRFDVEANPNKQVYGNNHHHHYHSSFMHSFFTYHMISSMFFNPWYGGWYGPGFYGRMGYYSPGYYGSNYGGRNVDTVRRTRTSYNRSPTSSTAMKTSSGRSVSSSLANQQSKGVSQYKASAISKRDSSRVKKASGFGNAPAKTSSSWGKSSSSKSSSSSWGKSSSSGSSWGRSSGRSIWGGGGSRGGK